MGCGDVVFIPLSIPDSKDEYPALNVETFSPLLYSLGSTCAMPLPGQEVAWPEA